MVLGTDWPSEDVLPAENVGRALSVRPFSAGATIVRNRHTEQNNNLLLNLLNINLRN